VSPVAFCPTRCATSSPQTGPVKSRNFQQWAFAAREGWWKMQKSILKKVRRVPMFPLVPVVPAMVMVTVVSLSVLSFRRLRRVEQMLGQITPTTS
jgi:hypothetical protein